MNTLNEILTISVPTELIGLNAFVLGISAALAMGLVFSFAMQVRGLVSKSFAVTLAILPPVVCVVITMVNGSIGAGIAVAGTFSLVRFRSIPGSAREIVAVFLAMAIGLACAMGNLLYASLFTLITTGAFLVLEHSRFGELFSETRKRTLRITLSENEDYAELFAEVFSVYTTRARLVKVKIDGGKGRLKLSYDLILRKQGDEKEFLNRIRSLNGNLPVISIAAGSGSEGL